MYELLRRGNFEPNVERNKGLLRERRDAMVHLVRMVLFIALTLVVTFSDISRIVAGDSLVR